jgi:hypothetical protein
MSNALISSDITDDTRRTRIHNFLHHENAFDRVLTLRPPTPGRAEYTGPNALLSVDSLRIYRLCKKCLFSVEVYRTGQVPGGLSDLQNIV